MADVCSCPGDLNFDGQVDGADLGQLLGAWGTSNPTADLNGSGLVDGADLGQLLGAWGPCAPIVNDACVNAIEVFPGQYTFCNSGATTDGPAVAAACAASLNIFYDVWYQYRALSSGQLTLETCGNADFDTVIAVYGSLIPNTSPCPGSGAGTATFVGCNDDTPNCGSGFASRVTVNVAAGYVYRIRVGSYHQGTHGTATLAVSFSQPGESCTNPRMTINNVAFQTVLGNTQDNPYSDYPSNCFGSLPDGPSEWVRWVAPCGGTIVASTCNPGTNFDTVITALRYEFDGNCWSTYLGCNDDSNQLGCEINGPFTAFRKSTVTLVVSPGEVLYFVVSGYNNLAGDFELTLDHNCN